jgi:hypothetical protein
MTQPPPERQSGKPAGGKEPEDAPRRNWAASVGRDATSAAAAAFVRAGFSDPTLVLHWSEIAGAEVARIARPVRFSAKDGTLTLLAEPAAALFLGHESRALAARINAYLGRPAVLRVKFIQGRLTLPPLPPAPPRAAKTINSFDPANTYRGPEAVKAALQSLARWRQAGPIRSA